MTLDQLIDALMEKRRDLGRGEMPVSLVVHSFNGDFTDLRTQIEVPKFEIASYLDGEIVQLEGELLR